MRRVATLASAPPCGQFVRTDNPPLYGQFASTVSTVMTLSTSTHHVTSATPRDLSHK